MSRRCALGSHFGRLPTTGNVHHCSRDNESPQRFRNEFVALSRLIHVNVFVSVSLDHGMLFFVVVVFVRFFSLLYFDQRVLFK